MDSIVIINRSPQADGFRFTNGELALSIPCWKTCLRQVYFTTYNEYVHLDIKDSDQVYYGQDASVYLISILCGMESPVFGETEVFGQFKNFLQSDQKSIFYFQTHSKWIKFILETVKFVRSQHINGLGSNSYGSTLRKLTKNHHDITIIGAGNLTQEVLPWLTKSKSIHILVRNVLQNKYQKIIQDYPQVKLIALQEIKQLSSVLIIAAPIDNSQIIDLIQNTQHKTQIIYDLRSSGFENLDQINNIKIISLNDFFEIANSDRSRFKQIKLELDRLIKEKCHAFANRSEVRPLGWDDLCL